MCIWTKLKFKNNFQRSSRIPKSVQNLSAVKSKEGWGSPWDGTHRTPLSPNRAPGIADMMMESCVSQHYVTPGATSLPMAEYVPHNVHVPPDMGTGGGCHPHGPGMGYLEGLPPGVGVPEYAWMKEKKTVRKPQQSGKLDRTRFIFNIFRNSPQTISNLLL